jgi:hypothetical protein
MLRVHWGLWRLLHRWRQIYGRDGNVIDLKTAEAEIIGKEEVRRLRREVEQLRQERDHLALK